MGRTNRRGRAAAAVLAMAVASAACGGGDEKQEVGVTAPSTTEPTTNAGADATSTTAATVAETTGSTSTSTSTSSSTTNSGPSETEALRRWLGADRLVTRVDMDVTASSDDGEVALIDQYPGVYADHLVADGTVIDYSGEEVCPGFELLGDFTIVDDVTTTEGATVVLVEDRRAMVDQIESGTTPIPRWHYDCATEATTEVAPTRTTAFTGDITTLTTTTPGGTVLVAEWWLGDSPVELSTGSGMVLIDSEAVAFDYVLSPDETMVFATTYVDTGAASPPNGVLAVDVATGDELWRRDVGGFVWTLGDRLVIEEVDPQITDFGTFAGREIVIVDPLTGTELERIPFSGRIVGLS